MSQAAPERAGAFSGRWRCSHDWRGPCLCCQFSKVSTPVLQKVVRRARRPEGEKGLAKAVNVEEQKIIAFGD